MDTVTANRARTIENSRIKLQKINSEALFLLLFFFAIVSIGSS